MKIKAIFSYLLTILIIYLLNNPFSIMPPIGKFFSPFIGFFKNMEDANIKYPIKTSYKFSNLFKEVNVEIDKNRIPKISGQTENDVYFIQGYLMAKERLWQMDIISRSASGRISEIFGEVALNNDKKMRRIGLVEAGKGLIEEVSSNNITKTMIDSYSAGVNLYINELSYKDYPLEFKLFDYIPENWTPLKSALILKYMALDLSYSEIDIFNTLALNKLNNKTFEDFYPDFIEPLIPVINLKKFTYIDTIYNYHSKVEEKDLNDNNLSSDSTANISINIDDVMVGSNNWTLNNFKTNNGKNLLLNDPHLKLNLPSIWYLNSLKNDKFSIMGVTLPGVPGVVIGCNQRLCWGMTNTGIDVTDWFSIEDKKDDKSKYFFDQEWKEKKLIVEEIKVKNKGTVYDSVYYSVHGPIVYDHNFNPLQLNKPLALRWTSHEKSNELLALNLIYNAKGIIDFRNALRHFSCPSQNFLVSDITGQIGINPAGLTPIRSKNLGKFVMPGNTSTNIWKDYIPFYQLPYTSNPKEGYLFSANQYTTYPTYNYKYRFSQRTEYYRNERIKRILDSETKFNIENSITMQRDHYSIMAEEFLPLFIKNLSLDKLNSKELSLIESMKKWDYNYKTDIIEPTFFQIFLYEFVKNYIDEITELKLPIFYLPEYKVIYNLFLKNLYFDKIKTEEKENINTIVNYAFKEAILKFNALPDKNWKSFRNAKINHLTNIPALSSEVLYLNGCQKCISAMASNEVGPSWKMIATLSDPPQILGIYPGGQSGNAGSKYYDNFIPLWQNGDFLNLFFE